MKQFYDISTLIFDFGGVLINLDLDRCIQNFKNLGLQNFENYLNNFGQKGFFLKFEKGEIGITEFRSEIRKLTDKSLTDEEIDDAWCSFLSDIPTEKLKILSELKKRFRIVLLSNTNPLHIEESAVKEFAKTNKTIADYFDACYLSYQMNMVKPNADIFNKLLYEEQVDATQCLFLDDGVKNIDQANSLGFNTYLVDTKEDLSFLLAPDTFLKLKI